jgi:hypothetical protein
MALFAHLLDQSVDAREITGKQVHAAFRVKFRSDQGVREMSRQECGEGKPARSLRHRQHRSNSHRHPSLAIAADLVGYRVSPSLTTPVGRQSYDRL